MKQVGSNFGMVIAILHLHSIPMHIVALAEDVSENAINFEDMNLSPPQKLHYNKVRNNVSFSMQCITTLTDLW